MLKVLGIDVDDELLARWRQWYAPEFQLFRSDGLSAEALAAVAGVELPSVSLEVRDTFGAYRGPWVSIREPAFRRLPAAVRDELLATRETDEVGLFRWPSELAAEGDGPLLAFVDEGAYPSRHSEVSEATWAACAFLLPHAAQLAGTFARRSGPNCFGAVMAAAGENVEEEHVGLDTIEGFLAARTVPVKDPDLTEPGVMVLWRRENDEPHHICVTLGDGWVLNKPAQAWWAPRYVWTVDQAFADNDSSGLARSTHQLQND